VYNRKEALSHICAQTALRRGTLAAMPLSALIRDGGAFILRIEGRLFKNRTAARFARNCPYEKKLEDIGGCYDALDRYLSYARPAMGTAGNPNFFVTSGGIMSGGQIYLDLFDITRRFISEQGREGPNITGLLPFGPSGYRHIVATHWLKKTRDLLIAAEAIHDDPKTVYDHYARYAPEDVRLELQRQWQTLKGETGTAIH
jgi:integrase